MNINFRIENQTIRRIDSNKVVNLSENYLQLLFDFKTDDWNNLSKFALFKHDGLTTRIAIINDSITVPSTLLVKNKVVFSVYGVTETDGEEYRITTNLVRFDLLNSGFTKDTDNPLPPDQPDLVEQIFIAISEKANITHTHTKSDISDFSHTHTKSEITDFAHNHDDRYYTESEVDAIIDEVKQELNNRVILKGDKTIIQTGDTTDFTAYAVKDGMPVDNTKIYFFKQEED